MQKKIMILFISLIFIIINFNGCIEETHLDKVIPSEQKTLYVDDNGDKNFSRIQDAVDSANPGDTIFVFDGIYNETLIINKPIKLIGSGSNNTIITSKIVDELYQSIIFLTVDNCIISGFTINNTSPQAEVIGIRIKSSNNTVVNNIIKNVTYGIYFLNDLRDEIITKNIISNNKIFYCDFGIFVFSEASHNTIMNNKILHNREGIDLYRATNNTISRNNVSLNNIYGIFITLESNSNNVSWNVITSNRYGIRFKGVINNEIFANRIVDNEIGLYSCCEAENNVLYYNSLIRNKVQANDPQTNFWNKGSIGNYWDDYTKKNPDAKQLGIYWDIPYNITNGNNKDDYPLIEPYI
jgi:parallel beta-helix repeat protein